MRFLKEKGAAHGSRPRTFQEDMCSESDHGLSWRATALVGSKLFDIGAELSPMISAVRAP
jgi:hypothetical protein